MHSVALQHQIRYCTCGPAACWSVLVYLERAGACTCSVLEVGGGSGGFIWFWRFLALDLQKMLPRKCHCDNFGGSFASRTLTASPFWLGIIFDKNVKKCRPNPTCFFEEIDLLQNSPATNHRWKMTAIGRSSYELFAKMVDFYWYLQYLLSLFMKSRFFIFEGF